MLARVAGASATTSSRELWGVSPLGLCWRAILNLMVSHCGRSLAIHVGIPPKNSTSSLFARIEWGLQHRHPPLATLFVDVALMLPHLHRSLALLRSLPRSRCMVEGHMVGRSPASYASAPSEGLKEAVVVSLVGRLTSADRKRNESVQWQQVIWDLVGG
jgi:hypothetical protein